MDSEGLPDYKKLVKQRTVLAKFGELALRATDFR